MNLSLRIARRYFFSRRNPTAINIIAGISIFGYSVGTWALVVLLSALNGFERVIFQVYDVYYPDLKLSPVSGKVFEPDSTRLLALQRIPEVKNIASCLEENAIVKHKNNQVVALIKGVGKTWTNVVKTDSLVVAGGAQLYGGHGPVGWMAEGLIYKLNLGREDAVVDIMAPRRESVGVAQMDMMEDQLPIQAMIRPGDEMNQKLVVAPLAWAQTLFEREGAVSHLEIGLKPGADAIVAGQRIQDIMGKGFRIQDRRQQNQAVYKMFNTEKWVTVGIMSFVLLLISFNLSGALSMLVIEKSADRKLLRSVGMRPSGIRSVFLQEGLMVSAAGTALGLLAGVGMVLLQQQYGFIRTNSTFVVAYPMELRWNDLLLITCISMALGLLSSLYPSQKSLREV
ncbi:MAG: FtsX-like permease family protein [Bacteroidetes bacterium]|nr:FtsX-like permease family protein [Bacteroidota bacterium]